MGALQRIGGKIAARQEIAVVGMLVLPLAMMVMPMPPMLADVLIAINIGLSVLLMMAAIQISAPVEFSTLLVEKAEVAVSPGIGFGEYGDGHVRIALVENKHRLRQAVRNIKAFMQEEDEAKPKKKAKKA